MVAPDRNPLTGRVEVVETEIACRSKYDPLTGGRGRSHQGKMLVVGATFLMPVTVNRENGDYMVVSIVGSARPLSKTCTNAINSGYSRSRSIAISGLSAGGIE